MKNQGNIPLFLARFFMTYFILFVTYSIYLKRSQQIVGEYQCSSITTKVALQTKTILSFLNYNTQVIQHEEELSIKLILNDRYVARVVEGCNSISIIILFLSFIIAFRGRVKATIIYGIIGSFAIYTINILRMVFLMILLYEFEEYQEIFHNLIFPAIIYGTTFLLWVVWIHKFSGFKNE